MRALLAAVLLSLAASAFAAPKDRGPAWATLNADQQQALAPLQNDWPRLSKEQKVKWIGITKRWPSMKPEEQKRAQARMQAWVKLTPEQRMQAREQYRSIATKVAPDHNKELLRRQWAEYQALPAHEKRMYDVPPTYVKPAERRKRAPAQPQQPPSYHYP